MSKKAPTTSATYATASSEKQNPDLAGWPQWMREALAYEPVTLTPREASRADEPAQSDRANVRILSRAPSLSSPKSK